MHPVLTKIFEKAGIKDTRQLTSEEKATYDKLTNDLEVKLKPIKIEDWIEFLKEELESIISSYKPDDSEKKKDYLWHQAVVINKFLGFLQGPEKEEKKIKKEYHI